MENRLLRTPFNHLLETQAELLNKAHKLQDAAKYINDEALKNRLLGLADGILLAYKDVQKVEDAMFFNLGESLL